jgi:hypothetical protein
MLNTNIFLSFLSLLSIIFCLSIIFNKKIKNEDYDYDYDSENPNALIKGQNIAGTVYSDNPENVPGLGWIL